MSITIFPSTCWLPSGFRNGGLRFDVKIGIVGLGVNRGALGRRSESNDPERNGNHREHESAVQEPEFEWRSNGLS